jgi:hypothetical protein
MLHQASKSSLLSLGDSSWRRSKDTMLQHRQPPLPSSALALDQFNVYVIRLISSRGVQAKSVGNCGAP